METLNKIKNNSTKKRMVILLAGVIFLVLAGYVFYLNLKEQTLNGQINSLKDSVKFENNKSKKLSNENSNLKSAVSALQEQIGKKEIEAQLKDDTKKDAMTANSVSELFVTGIKKRVIVRPGGGTRPDASYDFLAISLMIVNKSKVNQTYDVGNFYMISDTGKIFKPAFLADPVGDNSWYRSELAPGGSENVTFITLNEARLVSIVFTDPATGIQLTAPLPTVQ